MTEGVVVLNQHLLRSDKLGSHIMLLMLIYLHYGLSELWIFVMVLQREPWKTNRPKKRLRINVLEEVDYRNIKQKFRDTRLYYSVS